MKGRNSIKALNDKLKKNYFTRNTVEIKKIVVEIILWKYADLPNNRNVK